MATIPSTNFTSAQVIEEAAGSVRAFTSNDADVRNLAGVPSGGYSSANWAGKSSFAAFVPSTFSYNTEEAMNMGGVRFNHNGIYEVSSKAFSGGAGNGTWQSVANGTTLKVKVDLPLAIANAGSTDIEAGIRTAQTGGQFNNAISGQEYTIVYDGVLDIQFSSAWWSDMPDAPVVITINGKTLTLTIKSDSAYFE